MKKNKLELKINPLSWEKTNIRKCDNSNCQEKGEFKAPKSRVSLNEYYFFCLKHVKEYNKSWDFYKGLSVNQIESSMREDTIWNRPSWPLKILFWPPFFSKPPKSAQNRGSRCLSALKSRYKWDLETLTDVELRLIPTTHTQLLWKSDFKPKFCR